MELCLTRKTQEALSIGQVCVCGGLVLVMPVMIEYLEVTTIFVIQLVSLALFVVGAIAAIDSLKKTPKFTRAFGYAFLVELAVLSVSVVAAGAHLFTSYAQCPSEAARLICSSKLPVVVVATLFVYMGNAWKMKSAAMSLLASPGSIEPSPCTEKSYLLNTDA